MIAHVVTFNWRDGVTEDEVAEVYAAHRALADTVQGIRELHFGPGLEILSSSANYAVVVIADDVEGLRAYLDHPDHVALVGDHTSRMLARRNAVQIDWAP
jgi:hypothetical protein